MPDADLECSTVICSQTYFADSFNSRGARISFWFVDSLVDAFDLPLRPLDKRNVVRRADLFPNVAH